MNQQANLIRVVAGAVFNERGEVLLTSRPEGKPYAGYWEFAGGKVEENETGINALKREFAEELGIHIHQAQPWLVKVHAYEHALVYLRFYWVNAGDWSGELQAKEGQQWSWQKVGEFTVEPMLPANTQLLKSLSIPREFAGDVNTGFVGKNAQGEFHIVPSAHAKPHHQGVFMTFAEWEQVQRVKPDNAFLFVLVQSDDERFMSENADALIWQVNDRVAAQEAAQSLRTGVDVPVLVLANADLVAEFGNEWREAGAHSVLVQH
ncbi:MAG: NUDIX domain-containing protein [Neisseria sp.]|nr:NUDIX domain-containing protein [Neisseria sp.]